MWEGDLTLFGVGVGGYPKLGARARYAESDPNLLTWCLVTKD